MSDEQGGGWKIDATGGALERIMAAYGVKMQKDLAEVLGIAKHSVSGWVQRDAIPGNVIVRCCLDTGADINWLVTGNLANASLRAVEPDLRGKALYDEIMSNGGKHILRRLLDAYGFTMQKELGDLLDISSGTISTWIRREYFPGDVVVACALDTGVSLRWLATGKGEMFPSGEKNQSGPDIKKITKFKLESGRIINSGYWMADPSLTSIPDESLALIEGINHSWLVNISADAIGNGRWVIDIDDSLDVYDVIRLPASKIRLSNKTVSFECGIGDVKSFGSVVFTLEKNT